MYSFEFIIGKASPITNLLASDRLYGVLVLRGLHQNASITRVTAVMCTRELRVKTMGSGPSSAKGAVRHW